MSVGTIEGATKNGIKFFHGFSLMFVCTRGLSECCDQIRRAVEVYSVYRVYKSHRAAAGEEFLCWQNQCRFR